MFCSVGPCAIRKTRPLSTLFMVAVFNIPKKLVEMIRLMFQATWTTLRLHVALWYIQRPQCNGIVTPSTPTWACYRVGPPNQANSHNLPCSPITRLTTQLRLLRTLVVTRGLLPPLPKPMRRSATAATATSSAWRCCGSWTRCRTVAGEVSQRLHVSRGQNPYEKIM